MYTYIEYISLYYPNVNCTCEGIGSDYDSLVWESGGALPSKATLDAEILAQVKKDIWYNGIQSKRAQIKAGGVYISSVDKWFHSDDESRIQHIALNMMGANMPGDIYWKTMDGSFVVMTPALASAIFTGLVTLDQAAYTQAEVHKAGMMASSIPQTYDYSSGWPSVYTA